MKNYIEEGKILSLVAPAGGVVSGTGYVIGTQFVVAVASAAAGEKFPGLVEGVVELPKAGGAGLVFAEGGRVSFDAATSAACAPAAGKMPIGVAVESAVDAAVIVKVRLVPTQGQGANVAAIGATNNFTALGVTATTIAASNMVAVNPAAPTKAEVDTGIDTLKTAVVTALDLKADNADVETLRGEVETRVDGVEAKVDALLASLKASGLLLNS